MNLHIYVSARYGVALYLFNADSRLQSPKRPMTKRVKRNSNSTPKYENRSDALLIRRAVKENWETPPSVRPRIIREVVRMTLKGGSNGMCLAAVKTLLAMEESNINNAWVTVATANDRRN